MQQDINSYLQISMQSRQRALALMDKNPASATYGCLDRSFWYYRTLTNFSGATWQQIMLGLLSLNKLQPDPDLETLILAACQWWAKIQKKYGAFDEWYLNEKSYCPTAFTTVAATQVLVQLGAKMDQASREALLQAVTKSASWLSELFNPDVMNQNLAAMASLLGVFKLTGDTRWKTSAKIKVEKIAALQSQDGWLPEYGGPDIGYSTLSLDLLALSHRFGELGQVDAVARGVIRFLNFFDTELGTLPGRLGSRVTSHVFAAGAEYFSAIIPEARDLALRFRKAYSAQQAATPAHVDDRYFAYFYFPQFCLAAEMFNKSLSGECIANGTKNIKQPMRLDGSGFCRIPLASGTVFVSKFQGNSVAVCPGSASPPTAFLGYEAALAGKKRKRIATAFWDPSIHATEKQNEIDVASIPFKKVKASLPLVRFMIPFQMVLLVLRFDFLARWFQELAKVLFIKRRVEKAQLVLDRKIIIRGGELFIEDQIKSNGSIDVEALYASSFPPVYSPSARQEPGDFRKNFAGIDPHVLARQLVKSGHVEIKWKYEPERGVFETIYQSTSGLVTPE